MTPEQFAYWLQGFAELTAGQAQPSPQQWQAIKDHLGTVFNKVTPTVQPTVQHSPFVTWPAGVRTLELRQHGEPITTPIAHDQLARSGTSQLGTNIVC